MNLDDEMVSELDYFSWFPDGEDYWGDEAYNAFTSAAFGYAADASNWFTYVNHLKLSGSRLVPSNRFCRRIALWFKNQRHSTWEEADSLNSEDLVELFKGGCLARLDGAELTDSQYKEVMSWIVRRRLWIGQGHEFALVYELLNHPQTRTSRVRWFSDTIFKEVSRTPLVATSVLAAHPCTDRETMNAIARAYVGDGNGVRSAPLHLDPLPDFLENTLYEKREMLDFQWRRRFNKPVPAEIKNLYLSKRALDRRLLTSSYEDICHEAWWQALSNVPQREVRMTGGFRNYGARLEAGMHGMPPGVALMVSLRVLDAVDRDDFLDEHTESAAGMWVLPYLQGTRRWVLEKFGTADVPLSWVMQTLGAEEDVSRDSWNFLSPAWLANADARIHLGLPVRESR